MSWCALNKCACLKKKSIWVIDKIDGTVSVQSAELIMQHNMAHCIVGHQYHTYMVYLELQLDTRVYSYPNFQRYDDIIALIIFSLRKRHGAWLPGLFVDGAKARLPLHPGNAQLDFESEEGCPLETLLQLQMILVWTTKW